MEKLLKQVLKTVKPSKKEVIALEKVSSCITKKLKGIAKKLNVNSEIVIGGSASRGTWMSGNHDLDFFMRFKSEDEIRKHYRKIVTNCFKGYKLRLVHGTRDYYKFDYDGFDVEIVPSVKYGSPEKAGNSADISYFHINYLKKKFDNNPKLRNEVLLLKQCLKANDVYGAESARRGFSGYVSELLIIFCRSFKKLAEIFESAKPKIVIDIEKHYRNGEEVLDKLDKSKTAGPLIIVDPLLPDRNASAGVSYEAFSEFMFRLRYFLMEPMIKLFNPRGLNAKLVEERSGRRGTKLVSFRIKEGLHSDFDVTKAKLLRKVRQLVNELDNEGWSVYSYGVTDDRKVFIEFESLSVSRAKKHYGPFVWAEKKHFEQFFEKWKNNELGKPYVFRNKLVVDVYRKQDLDKEIKNYLKDYLC